MKQSGSKKKRKEYSSYGLEFKLAAVKRVLNGERAAAVARDLGLSRSVLNRWRKRYRSIGTGRWRGPGRPTREEEAAAPRETPEQRIAELERLVGQQTREVDFLARAFRRVKELRQASNGRGGTASTERSGQ